MPSKSHSNQEQASVVYVPIKVTAGILLHVGAGIYHSVAGALKELITNAYDADATQVVISTDYPGFNQIKVVDNGSGMSSERFIQAMRSIGSSLKAVIGPTRETDKYKRPIVGKLGIGLMALTQVCDEAVIESQAEGSDTKFIAKLDFTEFTKRLAADNERLKLDVIAERFGGIDEMTTLLNSPKTNRGTKEEIETLLGMLEDADSTLKNRTTEEEQLGYCLLYPGLPAVLGQRGTTLTLNDIHPAVRDLLKDVGRSADNMPKYFRDKYKDEGITWERYREDVNSSSWENLCKRLRSEDSKFTYQLLPHYHQFLWELSIMSPVRYLAAGPVTCKPSLLKEKKAELEKYKFSLLVDNRELLKPILLPSGSLANEKLEENFDYFIKRLNFDDIVDGETLRFNGYIFWQRKQVQPSSVRGVQIYIRNVGIGLYDPTLLNFSTVNITSRAGQMSGEIYVEEGLERALNVDRNSFRVTDEHYVALQKYVWDSLGSAQRGDGIIGKSIDSYWIRKEREEADKHRDHVKELRSLVEEISGGGYSLSFSEVAHDEPYDISNEHLTVYDNSPRWPRSSADKRLAQLLLISAQVAIKKGKPSKKVVEIIESILLR